MKNAQAKGSWMHSTLDNLMKNESKNRVAEGWMRCLTASCPEEFKSIAEAKGFKFTKKTKSL